MSRKRSGSQSGSVSGEAKRKQTRRSDENHAGEAAAALNVPAGTVLVGRIVDKSNTVGKLGGVLVQCRHGLNNFVGRVDVTHISDRQKWDSFPWNDLQSGQFVKCVVLKRIPNSPPSKYIDLSLRPSLLDPSPENLQAELEEAMSLPVHDTVVTGFVVNANNKGCFIRLTRALTARVQLKNLAQGFVKDVEGEFPSGKLVAGRVISVDDISNRVDLTLKPSAVVSESEKKHVFERIRPGSKIDGIVHRVIRSGILINVGQGFAVTGFCHLSEAFDESAIRTSDKKKNRAKTKNKDIQSDERLYELAVKSFRVGDKVRCFVLESDPENSKLKLALRPSYFEEEFAGDNTKNNSDESVVSDTEGDEEPSSEHSEDEQDAGNEESEENETDSDDNEDDEAEEPVASAASLTLQDALKMAADDDEEDADEPSLVLRNLVKKGSEALTHEQENEEGGRNLNSKRKDALKRRAEAATAELEDRLATDAEPQTEEEFERVLVFKASSSLVWIKYISILVSIGELDKARAVGERAIKAIPADKETELNNVWSALLSMELQFGSLDAAKTLFARMVRVSDEKWAYLTLVDAYDSLPSTYPDRRKLLDEAMRGAKKASKQRSAKVWIRHFKLEFDNEDPQAGRKLLKEALRLLPAHKHMKVMLAFARLEFTHTLGDVERARTVFNGLLENYPKRTDLWHVHIDLETKYGTPDHVRDLFERALSSKMSPKSMKALFKKWLLFESGPKGGGSSAVEEIKRRARAYVESLVGENNDD